MARLNRTIFNTLNSVFPAVTVLPGQYDIFLASPDAQGLPINSKQITDRFEQAGIETSLLTPAYIEYKLSPQRMSQIDGYLHRTGELNSDYKPVATYYNIALWNAMYFPGLKGFLDSVLDIRISHLQDSLTCS